MKKLPFKSATLNVLDFIDKRSPTALDDCLDIGKALVVRKTHGEDKNAHFDDSAETVISTMTATTVQYATEGYKSLQTVREAVTNPAKMKTALETAQQSEAWEGMLARKGHQLSQFQGDEGASVKTSVSRYTAWMDSPLLAANMRTSSFDLNKLPKGKMTIYLVPGLEHDLAGWLRLNIDAMLRACIKNGLQEKHKTHFIFDEAAALGHMEAVDRALDKGAGFGVRCQWYFQSAGQVSKCFPDQEQTFLSNVSQVFFGVNDMGMKDKNGTAEYISNRLGEATILVEDWNSSRGGSQSCSEGRDRSVSNGRSWNESSSRRQMARRLLKNEEALALDPRMAITFPGSGVPPVLTKLIRYFEEPWLFKRRGCFGGFRDALSVWFRALFFLVWMSAMAVVLTKAAIELKTLERLNYVFQSLTNGR